ncbi:hypothetical protein [Neisseria sp. 83E34]|uniref:hypothetical protein n=1 Tax=Neisseria sp. 83E34 TaxID=1692264 RepID=UPI0006CE822C|nr:hypothetical protein [Neisseria sp. 83E34]KPN71782.1 hypothetical protein AKG09_05765 [Neisseria sp. 83E34]
MSKYPHIILALLIGCVFGLIASQLFFAPSRTSEPLFDAPDAPVADFKTWQNNNWKFKLSSNNDESTAEVAVLENQVLPFKIMVNGATSPKFFQMDISGVPHEPYGTITLVGDEEKGFIKEVELWSAQKIYRLKRTKAGGSWTMQEVSLKK